MYIACGNNTQTYEKYEKQVRSLIDSLAHVSPLLKPLDVISIQELINLKNFSETYVGIDDPNVIKETDSETDTDSDDFSRDTDPYDFSLDWIQDVETSGVCTSKVKSLSRLALEEICKDQSQMNHLFTLFPNKRIWLSDKGINIKKVMSINISQSIIKEFVKNVKIDYSKNHNVIDECLNKNHSDNIIFNTRIAMFILNELYGRHSIVLPTSGFMQTLDEIHTNVKIKKSWEGEIGSYKFKPLAIWEDEEWIIPRKDETIFVKPSDENSRIYIITFEKPFNLIGNVSYRIVKN
jgi:hypothetical protein